MSGYSVAAPSALRQLRGLSGEQAYELWLDGGPSRWGSLSARNQARWETFARYLENHAITSINVTEKIIALLGGRTHPFDTSEAPEVNRGERQYTDAQIAEAAELFLHGALNVPDSDPVTGGDASMFVDGTDGLAVRVKTRNPEKFKVERPDGPYEVHSEVTAAVDTLANALKALLVKE